MNKKNYSSAIKKTPFEYLPSKKVAKDVFSGLFYNEVLKKCVTENELNITSDQRRQEVFNVVYDRVISLDSYLLKEFIESSVSTSKFILVYAIAKTDSLFMEFLLMFYREALIGNKKYISISDFDEFFDLIKEKNNVVAKWSKTTISQLSSGYRNILVESKIAKRIKKNVYPCKTIVNPEVIKHIKETGGVAFLQAVLGEK